MPKCKKLELLITEQQNMKDAVRNTQLSLPSGSVWVTPILSPSSTPHILPVCPAGTDLRLCVLAALVLINLPHDESSDQQEKDNFKLFIQ